MSGTRAVDRALTILHYFAECAHGGQGGLRLVDLTNATGLPHATVHRLVGVLRRHGFVRLDAKSKSFHVGPEIGLLSFALSRPMRELIANSAEHLSDLQRETGETAVMMVRTGYDMVLTHLETGRNTSNAATRVGCRRPLGVGASGIAILAQLEPQAAGAAILANRSRFQRFPDHDERIVRNRVRLARIKGYGLAHGVERVNVSCLSMAVHDADSAPLAALTIVSGNPDLPLAQARKLVGALDQKRRKIEAALRAA